MNPFSVVSYCQSNLPSIPSVLLQRRTSSATSVHAVVHTSPLATGNAPSRKPVLSSSQPQQQHSVHPHAPTTMTTTMTAVKDEQEHQQQQEEQAHDHPLATPSIISKPRSNPQAILPELEKTSDEDYYRRFADSMDAPQEGDPNADQQHNKVNEHSISSIPIPATTSAPAGGTGDLKSQRGLLQRHTSFHAIHVSPMVHEVTPARASMDSYDRARILKPSPADTVQATTMVSHPRPIHLRHTRSSSTPNATAIPSSPLLKPSLVNARSRLSASVSTPNIPTTTAAAHQDETLVISGEGEEGTVDGQLDSGYGQRRMPDAARIPEAPVKLPPPQAILPESISELTESQIAIAQALKFAEAQQAPKKAILLTPPPTPTLSATSTGDSGKTSASSSVSPLLAPAATPSTSALGIATPPSSPVTTPVATATVTPAKAMKATPATTPKSLSPSISRPISSALTSPAISPTPTSTTSSFLTSWQGRSRAMIPTIPRPSPLMPFRAARSVVHSVTSVGTGLLPSKEQLGSIPVAGRILKHPVMDSTLTYIAAKASERGISLSALTGSVHSKTLIAPEDIPYRKLNKKLMQQAMTLSILAMQKEEESKAMDDEAGDDAFELYLAAINTMLHALPFETCDPLRREAFETQLRDFLEDQLESSSSIQHNNHISGDESSSTSKRLRRRRRRRHRQHHEHASTLIQQHTAATTANADLSEREAAALLQQQQKMKQQQRQQRREQHLKEQQALKKLQTQTQLEKKEKKEKKEKEKEETKGRQQGNMGSVVAAAPWSGQASKSHSQTSSRRRYHRHRRGQNHQQQGLDHDSSRALNNPNSSPPASGAGGIGDTIISTAVHSAIRLKQSPIPDVVKSCLRTSKTIFHKVDERFHLQDKAWELSKQSIEKAIELDEQYAIHEVVTETMFATLTGLVKAGIAYKETPSYTAVKAAQTQGSLEGNPVEGKLGRSHHPQGIQQKQQQSKKQKDSKAKTKDSNHHHHQQVQEQHLPSQQKRTGLRASLAAAAVAGVGRAGWTMTSTTASTPTVVVASDAGSMLDMDSEEDEDSDLESEDDSDTEMTLSSLTSSSSSRMSSDVEENSTGYDDDEQEFAEDCEQGDEMEEEMIELNQQTLRSTETTKAQASLSSTPYTDQVREKIDMFMALKGAASLLYGNL
ncbi:hypothetical protein EDD11_000556 [Mortierella claussenii]|nr:hypothetical protein EDD11_000556 [Mortierella claussenii]